MIAPNLASKPVMNTRPVWLVTAAAALAALVLLALNLRLFFVANRALDDETARRDRLLERHQELEAAVRKDVDNLEKMK